MKPRLFDPLGILGSMWERDPMGNIFGAGGLCLCIDELHKFGLLYLQDGNWNGKQLIPKEWVRESTRKQAENETPMDMVICSGETGTAYSGQTASTVSCL